MYLSIAFNILLICIWSFVFVKILCASDGLLYWVPNTLEWIITFGKGNAMKKYKRNYFQFCVNAWYSCPKCHAGMLSTIYFPIAYGIDPKYWLAFIITNIFLTYNIEEFYDA